MKVTFTGEVWYWRGPAPWYFVTVPEEVRRDIQELSGHVSYGWGMIPATVTVGGSTWATSLFPKDGSYIVPLKTQMRRREGIEEGQTISLDLAIP
ncbi:DUF1905 domain-containing protein [Allokutzneria multivorans]|uniref:DUF1905 domain-containing protein n=1 Tax=Allokutzneria multivorans TaxID=1142134 RepID=A0ABP7T7B3_9PSEU